MAKERTASFCVAIDTREQRPWVFEGITYRYQKKDHPLIVPTKKIGLKTGDYSIVGMEDEVCIERKSMTDLHGTLTRGRQRFERELHRASDMKFAAVIVEGEWQQLLRYIAEKTSANPKSIDSSILAFSMRYPTVHWFFRPNRNTAMRTAFKILDMYKKERDKDAKRRQEVS